MDEEKKITRPNKRQKTIKNQTYEVTKDGLVGFIPRSKEEKKRLLKNYFYSLCKKRWMEITTTKATLEQTIVNELIDSL